MTEPETPPSTPSPAPGGEVRRLERAPGERYGTAGQRAAPGPGPGSSGRGPTGSAGSAGGSPDLGPASAPTRGSRATVLLLAVVVSNVGALVVFALGMIDIGLGLVAVAAFLGWVTALALVWRGREGGVTDRTIRIALAALLGGWAVAGGIVLEGVYALVQGGVLSLPEYVGERYGPVALLSILVAGTVAAVRVR